MAAMEDTTAKSDWVVLAEMAARPHLVKSAAHQPAAVMSLSRDMSKGLMAE
jgi:hypothetical protein